ncbi:hypothetical protein F4780DRAFT_393840 [Xylariomycetidae sp. FL0641]|nr:hypothetical protein F4780DRAFT_393840 [Xylariomycetidae sp. FL0641]
MMSAQLQGSKAQGQARPPPSQPPPADPDPVARSTPMANRAAKSLSPFVRSHANSLVAWQLLDKEAIDRATRENKLVFLHIGFFASHHCYIAQHEVFSHSKIANFLNEHFIPILIDREEYPNIDNIYMSYNQSLNSTAGWPLNVFVTPELEPVFSGTYWALPDTENDAAAQAEGAEKPVDWLTVLEKTYSSWKDQETRLRQEAKNTLIHLGTFTGEGTLMQGGSGSGSGSFQLGRPKDGAEVAGDPERGRDYSADLYGELDLEHIEEAVGRIAKTFDTKNAGFGQKEKHLTPPKLSFLLRAIHFPKIVQDVVGPDEASMVTKMGLHTLRRIKDGAINDHVGGGFYRFSVTSDWSLPSFEKMLIDNALLLGVFLDAWLVSGSSPAGEFADTVASIADYLISDHRMLSDKGGFFTSEKAGSYNRRGDEVMRNGTYYLWTRKEFDTIVGDDLSAKVAAAYWDVREHGNIDSTFDPHDEFLNQNVLRVVTTPEKLATQFHISERQVRDRIDGVRLKLHTRRERERIRPEIDKKIVAAYNGMAIAALSRTAAVMLELDPRSQRGIRYLTAAKNTALFIKNELWDGRTQTLYRYYHDGRRSDVEGFSEDYAYLIEGLLELYGATAEEAFLQWAHELQEAQIKGFYDFTSTGPNQVLEADAIKCGGFYSTRPNTPHTVLRIKDAMDGALPATNAVAVSNLFRLAGILGGDQRYGYLAKESISAFSVEMLEYPNLFPGLLCGVVAWRLGGTHWTISAGKGERLELWKKPDGADTVRLALGAFRRTPRAGLFTIRFVDPVDGGTWLREREPRIRPLVGKKGVFCLNGDDAAKQVTEAVARLNLK